MFIHINFKDSPLRLPFLPYLLFLVFIISVLIFNVDFFICLRPFALLSFFFVPGYMLLIIFPSQNNFSSVESILLSFGSSLAVIISITYLSFLLNNFDAVVIIITIITTLFFILFLFKNRESVTKLFSNLTWRKINQKIDLFCDLRFVLNLDKYTIAIILISFLFFSLAYFIKLPTTFRMPDEYYYLWSSNYEILTHLQYRDLPYLELHPIYSSWLKLGYILILSFSFGVSSSFGLTPHLLFLLFYSILIIATYLIGSLHNKKTGLLAALFIGSNPIIWFWNSRIMPDILFASLAIVSFYFFYKAFNLKEKTRLYYFVLSLFFAFITYTIEPKLIFVWGFSFIIYFLTGSNKKHFLLRTLLICGSFGLLIAYVCFFAPWFFSYDFPKIIGNLFSVFSFSLTDWVSFFSPQGVTWYTWGYPYYYSHAMLFLFLVGSICFILKHTKRESFLFLSSIFFCLFFHATAYSNQGPRFSFLIFPLLMSLAAIGFSTNLKRYSLILPICIFFLFPIFPINEPGIGTFLPVTDSFVILSRFVAILLIIYKIVEGISPDIMAFYRRHLKKSQFLIITKYTESILLVIIVLSTLSTGISITTNSEWFRNDYVTPDSVGLPQAGSWLTENISVNSTIITNVRPQILSYYSNYQFDIQDSNWVINRDGIGKIITPLQAKFTELLNSNDFNYLVVFSESVVGEHWRRSHFMEYLDNNTLFTIYETLREEITITPWKSTDEWIVTQGNVTLSLDEFDEKGVSKCIKLDGVTSDNGRTRLIYNLEMPTNLEDAEILTFGFKLDEVINPNYFSLILKDASGNIRYWANSSKVFDEWVSHNWQKHEISLNTYSGQEGLFNIKEVKQIMFYVYADPISVITYHIDDIQAYSTIKKVYAFSK